MNPKPDELLLGALVGVRVASDITSSTEVAPTDYVEDGDAETPVSEEIEHQRRLDAKVDELSRARLAVQVLGEVADNIDAHGNLQVAPSVAGALVGVVVAIMQQTGWQKSAAMNAFGSIWGDEEGYEDAEHETN